MLFARLALNLPVKTFLEMKIIVAESTQVYNKTDENALNIMEACPRIWFKADSALLTNGKPMFVPDFTGEMSASPYLALRICRMGKSIPARFAYRYYDAACVAVDFTAEDVLRQLSAKGEPWDMAKSFDGSVCVGQFTPTDVRPLTGKQIVSLVINGKEMSTIMIDDVALLAGEVIERVSRFFTLRQGDLLLIGKPDHKPVVEIDSHIEGRLNDDVLTEFNVK